MGRNKIENKNDRKISRTISITPRMERKAKKMFTTVSKAVEFAVNVKESENNFIVSKVG